MKHKLGNLFILGLLIGFFNGGGRITWIGLDWIGLDTMG